MLQKTLSRFLTFLASVTLALFLLGLAGLRLTWSGSIPRGLYLAVDRPVERGAIVLVCLPKDVSRWTVGRGYLRPGSCPGDGSLVGKPVVGVAGDLVDVDEDGLRINDHRLPRSRRAPVDSIGRPMPYVDPGRHRLDAGELWLHSGHHERSLDSRVYGPVPVEGVREILVPLWVEESP